MQVFERALERRGVYIGQSDSGVDHNPSVADPLPALWFAMLHGGMLMARQDPHLVALCPAAPDVMWQQTYCGVFVSSDGAATWQEVSGGPVHFGCPITVHPTRPGAGSYFPPIYAVRFA